MSVPQPVQVEALALLLSSAEAKLHASRSDDGTVTIAHGDGNHRGEKHQPPSTNIVDQCCSAGDGSSTDAAAPTLVDALLLGQDAVAILCGATGADQRREMLGDSMPSSPSKGGAPSSIGAGSLLKGTAELLFARLREAELASAASGLRRTHEVRVSCLLLQRESPIDLLEQHSALPPALRLKRSQGRRGVHVSGLRSIVVFSADEVSEAAAVAATGLRALATPGSQAIFELQVSQRLTWLTADPLAGYASADDDGRTEASKRGAGGGAGGAGGGAAAGVAVGAAASTAVDRSALPAIGEMRVLSARLRLALTEAGIEPALQPQLPDPIISSNGGGGGTESKALSVLQAVVHALSRPSSGAAPLSPGGGGAMRAHRLTGRRC